MVYTNESGPTKSELGVYFTLLFSITTEPLAGDVTPTICKGSFSGSLSLSKTSIIIHWFSGVETLSFSAFGPKFLPVNLPGLEEAAPSRLPAFEFLKYSAEVIEMLDLSFDIFPILTKSFEPS